MKKTIKKIAIYASMILVFLVGCYVNITGILDTKAENKQLKEKLQEDTRHEIIDQRIQEMTLMRQSYKDTALDIKLEGEELIATGQQKLEDSKSIDEMATRVEGSIRCERENKKLDDYTQEYNCMLLWDKFPL